MSYISLIKKDFLKPKNFGFDYLNRKYEKFFDTRILENQFEDFDTNYLHVQIKVIYDDLKNALENKEIPFILKSMHPNVFKITEKNITNPLLYKHIEQMGDLLSDKSNNFRLVDLKIYNANDFNKDEKSLDDKKFCLILYRYYSEDFRKNRDIVFIRDLENTKSFYDWKMLDYNANMNIGGKEGFLFNDFKGKDDEIFFLDLGNNSNLNHDIENVKNKRDIGI